MLQIAEADIGGARVRRIFTMNGRSMRAGETLTGEQVRALPTGNRQALVEAQYIELWPAHRHAEGAERHVVSRGGGRYDVYEGVKLNEHGLSKEEAEELANA